MNKVWCLASFIGGGIIGAGGAYVYLTKKHDKEMTELEEKVMIFLEEESAKIKEQVFGDEDSGEDLNHHLADDELEKYEKEAEQYKAPTFKSSLDKVYNERIEEPQEVVSPSIFVIDPAHIGDEPEYDVITMTYYEGDDIVAGSDDKALENWKEHIGDEALESYGRYEDDCVYVRNDIFKCYYEVVLDKGRYEDTITGF